MTVLRREIGRDAVLGLSRLARYHGNIRTYLTGQDHVYRLIDVDESANALSKMNNLSMQASINPCGGTCQRVIQTGTPCGASAEIDCVTGATVLRSSKLRVVKLSIARHTSRYRYSPPSV